MPRRPAKPCGQARCRNLTRDRYCDEHRPLQWSGDRRPASSQRGYDAAWRKKRREVLAREPFCRHCHKPLGQDAPVDHIVPIDEAPEMRLQDSNLQPLCVDCHARKTAKDRARVRSRKVRSRRA